MQIFYEFIYYLLLIVAAFMDPKPLSKKKKNQSH